MTTPAEASIKSLTQTIFALNTESTYTIQYTTMNARVSGSSYLVTYPSTVSTTGITTCNGIYNSVTYPLTCLLDTGTSSIKVSNLNVAIPKGSSI